MIYAEEVPLAVWLIYILCESSRVNRFSCSIETTPLLLRFDIFSYSLITRVEPSLSASAEYLNNKVLPICSTC